MKIIYRIDGMIWPVIAGSIAEGMAIYAAQRVDHHGKKLFKAQRLVTLSDVPWQTWQEV